ncbi:AMP-binding protein [Mycolicibacterium farcinogenes]|uniref:AMP-binding protein n=1 Tax=Mycolicibacterium farcinogenes TaxID=1802 RepID=UPI001C8EC8E4|nr:AMP-binding protein [Mycolicibacterium farcinogenes]QZH59713.1 AMP-binding protein [Mycolicibacterium farcinogenes]
MLRSSHSAHVDMFTRDNLPLVEHWPELQFFSLGISYGDRLNCATELLQGHGGDRPCLITPSRTYTYADIRALSGQIAYVLVDGHGLVPGNRVLLHGRNTAVLVASWLACLRAGLVVVTTAPQLSGAELGHIAKTAEVNFALVQDDLEAVIPTADVGGHLTFSDLADCAEREGSEFHDVDTAADDVALLAFTSGTTGKPKATMHFHRDVLAIADTFSAQVLRTRPDDVFAGTPPLGFTFGLGALVVFPMRAGAASLLLERATPDVLLDAVVENGVTQLFTAPTAYRKMLDQISGPIPGLRICVSAGEPMTEHTWNDWRDATGIRIVNGIGTTEMLHIFLSTDPSTRSPAGALGSAVPGYQVSILDDQWQPVPSGDTGYLAVRGPTGCRYLADSRQSGYVRNGWNVTGDLCVRDGDGHIWYRSRADDMIITAGYSVAPAEVEMALLQHSAVVDCVVVGVPDHTRTMLIKAVVVLRSRAGHAVSVDALREHCRGILAAYKVPHEIEIVESVPRTSTGKVQRFRLRNPDADALRPSE